MLIVEWKKDTSTTLIKLNETQNKVFALCFEHKRNLQILSFLKPKIIAHNHLIQHRLGLTPAHKIKVTNFNGPILVWCRVCATV